MEEFITVEKLLMLNRKIRNSFHEKEREISKNAAVNFDHRSMKITNFFENSFHLVWYKGKILKRRCNEELITFNDLNLSIKREKLFKNNFVDFATLSDTVKLVKEYSSFLSDVSYIFFPTGHTQCRLFMSFDSFHLCYDDVLEIKFDGEDAKIFILPCRKPLVFTRELKLLLSSIFESKIKVSDLPDCYQKCL